MKLCALKNSATVFGESDELMVLYEDKKAVCIEGNGLWMTLKNAKVHGNQLEVFYSLYHTPHHYRLDLDSASPENLSVNYKKWAFSSQQEIFDISILGMFSCLLK